MDRLHEEAPISPRSQEVLVVEGGGHGQDRAVHPIMHQVGMLHSRQVRPLAHQHPPVLAPEQQVGPGPAVLGADGLGPIEGQVPEGVLWELLEVRTFPLVPSVLKHRLCAVHPNDHLAQVSRRSHDDEVGCPWTRVLLLLLFLLILLFLIVVIIPLLLLGLLLGLHLLRIQEPGVGGLELKGHTLVDGSLLREIHSQDRPVVHAGQALVHVRVPGEASRGAFHGAEAQGGVL
mmetsp:Transcript_3547/g.6172  ORF Transcript_3547/g.6172 Transcript_3547/m.6172 type:complete len:232 (+) Transcript_3547:3539-4234(+)